MAGNDQIVLSTTGHLMSVEAMKVSVLILPPFGYLVWRTRV
jgi:hypothetical protein